MLFKAGRYPRNNSILQNSPVICPSYKKGEVFDAKYHQEGQTSGSRTRPIQAG